MKSLLRCLCVATLCLGACGDGGEEFTGGNLDFCEGPSPAVEGVAFGAGTAIIETDNDTVMIDLEVADTPEERALGLMFRESLPEDCGMVFIYFEDSQSGFYMKNTLIPLSVAFFDEEGVILGIVDMEPCESDPCEIYGIEQPYRGGLEVNQGAFDDWGVSEGDVISIR